MPNAGDYLLEHYPFAAINAGLVPGLRTATIAGYNPALSSGVEAPFWPKGTQYVWPTRTGETMKISSDNVGDAGILILVTGLDGSGLRISEVVACGTVATPTVLTKQFGRINGMLNTTTTSLLGNVSLTSNDGVNTYSYIAVGDNIARQMIYTIPSNEQGFFLPAEVTINSAAASGDSSTIWILSRQGDGAFLRIGRWGVQKQGTSAFLFEIKETPLLPPGLDLILTAKASSNNVDVAAHIPMLLFEADGGNILT